MPENPIYDPTKIVKRAYVKDVNSSNLSEPSTDGEVPKYDASKIVKRGYVAKDDFQEEGFSPNKYISDTSGDNIESTLDFIQKNSRRIMRDDEKDILRDMFRNPNATKEDISDAIVTLQGKKAKQQENTMTTPDYYMDRDEKGVYKPIALSLGEKTPKGKETVSIWGTQKKADDDAWYTDVAKTAFNIIPGVIGGVVDVAQLGTQLVTGEESEWLKQAQLGTEALKFKKDVDISKSIYNTEDINKFTDLFDSERFDFSPETIWGTALSAAGFMGEMLVPASIISKGAKGYKAGRAGLAAIEEVGDISKVAKKASVFAGSFMTQVGDVMESSADAGLDGRSKAVYDLAIGSALALVDAKYDVAGKILSNKLAQGAKKEMLTEVGKKVVKDEFGNITKESLNQATKEAMAAYTPVVSGFVKNFGRDVLDEVKDETLQSFIEKAGQNVYDKLSPQEKANFGTDAFSAKSFGEYINSAVSGLVGAGAPSLISAKGKQQVDYKAQSNNAYETVMQGEEAVKAFKTNITNAFQAGQINKEDYDNAILKVDSYDSYEKVSKDLTLDNENKKKLFELSLQKENLKAAIKFATEKDKEGKSRLDQMLPPELALHNSKVEQADKIQKEIDLIVTKSEVLQQPEVAEKVVEKVVKAEEKATEGTKVKEGVSSEIGAILGRQYKVKAPVGGEVAVPGKAAYEVPKKVLEEKRKMKEIPVEEFNDPNFDVTVKQAKLAEALDETPEKTTTGTLQIDNEFTDDKGRKVQTFNITLPNGKAARFASSMVRFPEEEAAGGYRGFTYEENLTNRENPVGQKLGATVRTLKDSGRKVIFVWNADEGPKFGKHIGMVKERLRGKSDYSEADIEEMADLRMINMGQNPNAPAPGIITPEGPVEGGPKAKVAVPVKNKEVRDKLKGLGYSKAEIQAMEPQEANDIVKEQKEKSKVKTELKEVEIKEKKSAARANEAKRIAEVNAIIAEDKKKTGGAYITRTAAAKIDEVNARYAALEKPTSAPTDLEAKKADIERRRQEVERISKLPFVERIPSLIKEGIIQEVYQYGNRPIVIVNINGQLLPFYRSSSGTSGKEKGKWFPMFGFGKSKSTDTEIGWLIKPSIKDLENNLNSKAIEEYSSIINSTLNWEHSLDTQSLNNPFFKPFVTLTTDEEGFNKKIFGQKDLAVINDGKTSYQHIDNVVNIINAKYDAELKALEGATKTNEEEIADLRAQEQEELKREIPNIDKYKIDGKVDENLIKDAEDLKKYKEIYKKYDEKISPLLGKEPAKEKGKVVVKKAPKEVVVKKEESIAKRKALMESILGTSKLVAAYNNLTKTQKRSKVGVDLYKKIQDRVKEIGYTTTISKGGTLQLMGEKGKRVYKTPIKRTEDQKAMEKEKKEALGAEPTSIAHSIILDIANGLQFDVTSLKKYFSEAVLKEMPSLLKNSKGKGINLEFYKQRYDESFGLKEPSNLDEEEVAQEAADVLGNYFMDNYRQAATEDAIDINFKTKNEGMSRSQVEDLNEMQKEQEREQKELEDILAQEELTKEEYRKQAEEGGYYQKAKVKPATLNKFEKSVDLFYKTKDADGASKKRSLAAERREFLEKNPTVKYIDDNMKYIYKQLEEQNIIERKGECP